MREGKLLSASSSFRDLCIFVKDFSVLDKCNVTWWLTMGSYEKALHNTSCAASMSWYKFLTPGNRERSHSIAGSWRESASVSLQHKTKEAGVPFLFSNLMLAQRNAPVLPLTCVDCISFTKWVCSRRSDSRGIEGSRLVCQTLTLVRAPSLTCAVCDNMISSAHQVWCRWTSGRALGSRYGWYRRARMRAEPWSLSCWAVEPRWSKDWLYKYLMTVERYVCLTGEIPCISRAFFCGEHAVLLSVRPKA